MPESIDKKLEETCQALSRIWSERYVKDNDDLGYIRTMWNIIELVQSGQNYTGEYIPSWPTIETTITDCYLDLLGKSSIEDMHDRRVESLIQVYNSVMKYVYKKMKNMQPGDMKEYLEKSLNATPHCKR